MAYKSIYTYNKPLEEMRKRIEQRTYEMQQERKRQMEEARSMRTIFDVFLNKKGREKYDNGNWFETTFKAFGEYFDRNYTEWFRNPANALINNLSSIGDTLDYAANLIKAPLIAVAKGEDVGQRLADAYGVGDNGRIAQNMSDLREALGANDPGAEIGASTGFGALAGAEIGSKGGVIGLAVGSLIGAALGAINSGIDVGIRESGTDNAFLKGTQTVANTVTDMIMEYGVDPANFFGAISNVEQATKINNIVKQYEGKQLIDTLADNAPATRANYLKFVNGKKSVNVQEALDEIYHRSAFKAKEAANEFVLKHPTKDISKFEQKMFKRNIKNTISAYVNGDKKAFNRAIAELGMQGEGLETALKSTKQVDALYSVLRQDANLSALGRFANFVDNFDQGFAKKLYKSTVPGIALTSAKKAFIKAKYAWNKALITAAERFDVKDTDDVTKGIEGELANKYTTLEKMAIARFERQFDNFKLDNGKNLVYKVREGASPKEVKEAYDGMSEAIAKYRARGKSKEARALQGYRKQLVLDNGIRKIKLADAELAMKKIIRKAIGDKTITEAEADEAANTLFSLFYFEEGINFFQDMMFTPRYFRGNMDNLNAIVETLMNTSNKIIDNRPEAKYIKELERISNMTINWNDFSGTVAEFYSSKLSETTSKILDELYQNPDKFDEETASTLVKRLQQLVVKGDLNDDEIEELYNLYQNVLDTEYLNTIFYPGNNTIKSWTDVSSLPETDEIVAEYKYIFRNGSDLCISPIEDMTYKHIQLENISKDSRYAEDIKEYVTNNKTVRDGAKLRNTFNGYNKSIDNSKDIIKDIETTANSMRKVDQDKLEKLISQRIKIDVIKAVHTNDPNAIDTLLGQIRGLVGAFEDVFDSDDPFSTYDMALKYGNLLSKGSTQLFNMAISFSIDPSKVDEFLIKFKNDYTKILEFSKQWTDDDFKKIKKILTSIKNNTSILTYIEANLSSPIAENSYEKAVFDYIFRGIDFDKNVPDNIKNTAPGLFTKENHELLARYYNELTKITGNTYLGGTSFSGRLKNAIYSLGLSVDKNGKVLKDGTFINAQIQQTMYNNVVKGLLEWSDGIEGNWKDVYKAVAKAFGIDNAIMDHIQRITNKLFSKRWELIKTLAKYSTEDYKSNTKTMLLNVDTEISDINYKLSNTKNRLDKILYTEEPYSFGTTSLRATGTRLVKRDISELTNYEKVALSSLQNEYKTLLNNKDDLIKIKNDLLKHKDIESLKKHLVKKYIADTSKDFDILKSMASSLFAINILDVDNIKAPIFKDKFFVEAIEQAKTYVKTMYSNKFLSKSLVDDIKKSMVLGIATKASDKNFKHMYEFLDKFSDDIKSIRIQNGKFIIESGNNIIKLTANDFNNLFNNTSGLYKYRLLCDYLASEFGIGKYNFADGLFRQLTLDAKNFYTKNIKYLIDGTAKELDVEEFNNLINNYKKAVNNFAAYKTQSKFDIKTKDMKKFIDKYKYTSGTNFFVDINTPNSIKITDYDIFNINVSTKISLDKHGNVVTNQNYKFNQKRSGIDNSILNRMSYANKYVIDFETKMDDKTPLQLSLCDENGNTVNYLLYNPTLSKNYNQTRKDLLDSSFVTDEIWKQNEQRTIEFIGPDGKKYTRYASAKVFAKDMIEVFKKRGMIKGDTLYITGHNASRFDAETMLLMLAQADKNPIKYIDVMDTLDLAKLYYASINKNLDDFTLGTVYEDLFPGKVAIGAHNADVDTSMNMDIWKEIYNKISSNPTDFFMSFTRDNLLRTTDGLELLETIKGLNFDLDVANIKDALYNAMIDDNSYVKNKGLRTSVSDEYIEKYIYNPFVETYNSLISRKDNINTYKELISFVEDYKKFMDDYGMYLFKDSDQSVELYKGLKKLTTAMQDRMKIVYGNHMSYISLNQQYREAYILDNFFNTFNDETKHSAIREVMSILSDKSIDSISKSKPKTRVGTLVKQIVVSSSKDKLFEDFPEIRKLYNYTNRIKKHMDFRNEIFTILEDTLKNKNAYEQDKIRMAFSTILDGLFGYGKDERTSLDRLMTNYLRFENMDNLDYDLIKEQLIDIYTNHILYVNGNSFDYFKDTNMYSEVSKYITDCIDNIENCDIDSFYKKGIYEFTILHPTPSKSYADLLHDSLAEGLLGKYQTSVNPIKAKTAEGAIEAQLSDQAGLIDDIRSIRDALIYLDKDDLKRAFNPLPTAYLESINNKSAYNINSSMSMYSLKNANEYSDEFNEIYKAQSSIYKAFNKPFNPIESMPSQQGRNVETQFFTLVKKIKERYGLSSSTMEQIADSISPDNEGSANYKYVLSKFFDDYMTEDDELFKDFRDKVYNFYRHENKNEFGKVINSYNDLDKDPELFNKVTESIKAYFAMNYIMSSDSPLVKTVDDKYRLLTDYQMKLKFANDSFNESKNAFIDMFTDSNGKVNYALMYKYIKENDRLELVARIPSDRYNNTDRGGNYRVGIEFLSRDFNSPEELQQFLEMSGSIKYSILDKHNLMKIRNSIGQLTSKKTYTNRRLFNNHPHLQKLMNFRDTVNRYLILPTKVFGLWNLGFTTTNTFEGMLKTMIATDGNRLTTLKRYHKAIKMHRQWSSVSGDIAEAIQGSTFCMNRNQWDALIKEYTNMIALFGDNNEELMKLIKNHPEGLIKYKDNIIKTMKSESEYIQSLRDSGEVSKVDIDKLLKKYKKLNSMSDEDIAKLVTRYTKTTKLFNELPLKYNRDEFNFVTNFINSPAAAAEMQNIKKAAKLNLIGNDAKDNAIDKLYKKVLFSEFGMSDKNPLRVITPYYNLSLNSDIETINRLALHLDLLDKGFTESKAFDRVLQAHFNYGDKSELELFAELFFPFISFPVRTALFWDEMMDEHPQLIKVFADLVLTNWGKDAQNQYNQTKVTKGGLRISPNVSMESGASFLDSLMFAGNTLNVLQNRKLNPIAGTVIEGAKQLMTGESNLNYRLSRLPLVSHTMAGINLVNNLSKGQVKLYDIAPSIFSKVYEENRYYYNNQERYKYRSIYNRLYTATGKNRWNTTSPRGRLSAVRNLLNK